MVRKRRDDSSLVMFVRFQVGDCVHRHYECKRWVRARVDLKLGHGRIERECRGCEGCLSRRCRSTRPLRHKRAQV